LKLPWKDNPLAALVEALPGMFDPPDMASDQSVASTSSSITPDGAATEKMAPANAPGGLVLGR
jgi:hypothetical protein